MTGARLRVLLVEDSPDDAELVRRALVKAGFTVTLERAESASEMEACLDASSWDVVISDHVLPGFCSTDALAMIKRRGLDVPFIIVSGCIGEEAAVDAMQAGAHDYVMKDRMARLAPAITRAMAHRALRRRQEEQQAELDRIQQLDALGTLAAGMAHDVNNILTIVLVNAQLAAESVAADQPAAEHLAQIAAAAEMGRDVVNKILAFGRQQHDDRIPINPRELVADLLPLLRAGAPDGFELHVVHHGDSRRIMADETLLRQALMNLVTNAWQAIDGPDGRVTLTIDRVATTGEAMSGLPDGGYARIAVSDNGRGMDASTAARVFEPFFTTRSRGQGGGTGLGLAVVHGIVRQHGGAIKVESEPGSGTTFTVYLPECSESDPSDAATAPGVSGQHVLYVEDDPLVSMATTANLRGLGYLVTPTHRPAEALAALRARPDGFQLVLLDLHLPEMSGLQLAREITAAHPGLPIVLTSGTRLTDEQLSAAGIGHRLEKPYSDRALARTVAAALAPAGMA